MTRRGEVIAEHAFGLANLDTGEKLTPRRRFRIASTRRYVRWKRRASLALYFISACTSSRNACREGSRE